MDKASKQTIGMIGENAAASFLAKHGFTIVGRNIHVSHKEIDLIVEDKENFVFVEVKTRRQDPTRESPYGRPSDAVDYKKRKYIYTAAEIYLEEHPTDKMPRIDVIEVYLSPKPSQDANPAVLKINWFQNAFGGDG